jgi:threonine synthase
VFDKKEIASSDFSLWRYRRFFPYVADRDVLTLGEGWTPLVKVSDGLHLKLDFLNPTGSFKDRGSAVLVSAIHRSVKASGGVIAEDSSGNAGASIAAYAARAGLKSRIFVPSRVSGTKSQQISWYGAEVVRVEGERGVVAARAQQDVKGQYYVGHSWHPFFRDGIRSLAYELYEQLGWRPPQRIYLPASAGTLLLGMLSGLTHLVESGITDNVPTVVACQTEQVPPLYRRFNEELFAPSDPVTTIADALVTRHPPLLETMVANLRAVNGEVEIVAEKPIYEHYVDLARKGVFVEPSSAVAYAVYTQQLEQNVVSEGEDVVIVLTGSGLKQRPFDVPMHADE